MADTNFDVNEILEQVSFLLEKQTMSREEIATLFGSLLTSIVQVIESLPDGDDRQSLERTHDLLTQRAKLFSDDVADDIHFLKENIKALEEIKSMDDDARAQEMLDALVGDDVDLKDVPSTQSLKVQVEAEMAVARESLVAFVEDIKAAIQEKDFANLEAMLISLVEEDAQHDEEDECCDRDCSGCSVDCSLKEGVDIFKEFETVANKRDKEKK